MVNNRVILKDTIQGAVTKMVDGNPGATYVSMQIIQQEEGSGFIHYLKLDNYGIYGPRIWMCYKDLCGEDIDKLYSLLRNNKLQEAIKEKCQANEIFSMEWEYYK